MRFLRRVREGYKKGYDLAREIHTLRSLYGLENFVKGNVQDKDRRRLERITNELRHMYAPSPNATSLYMACGFLKYRLIHRTKCSSLS